MGRGHIRLLLCFLSNSRHFCRAPRSQDGLAEHRHGSLGMWASPPLRPVWGQVSLCPHRQSPGARSPPSAQGGTCTPTKEACLSRGKCVLHLCLGHLSTWATHTHLWVHPSRPCSCQCMDRHADGTQDATRVCLSLSQATVTAATGPRGMRADAPVGSLRHFWVGAACTHVRACCPHRCECVRARVQAHACCSRVDAVFCR